MRRIVKWLGIPALAAAFGFYGLGPRLAGNSKLTKLVQEGKEAVESHTPIGTDREPEERPTRTTPDSGAGPGPEPRNDRPFSEAPAPKVTVGVKPVDAGPSGEDAPKPRTRRHRHPRAQTSDEAPPETTTTPDRKGPDPASTP